MKLISQYECTLCHICIEKDEELAINGSNLILEITRHLTHGVVQTYYHDSINESQNDKHSYSSILNSSKHIDTFSLVYEYVLV